MRVSARISLPSGHQDVLDAVVEFFRSYPGVVGGTVAGSVARGVADEFSDLDLGIFFADEAARDAAWADRWEWALGSWFHRFDADHVRPHFVIYLLEPGVKTDIPLFVAGEPPEPEGAPFEVLWDTTGEVTRWVEASNAGKQELAPDWDEVVHEEERLWAWTYYCVLHARRGEVYDVASDFGPLRAIVEAWHARLRGQAFFDVRRVHERDPETVEAFAALFPRPELRSVKHALQALLGLHERQRTEVDRLRRPAWRTKPEARERIRRLVDEL
jgi:predicted nucleotidyltransferase